MNVVKNIYQKIKTNKKIQSILWIELWFLFISAVAFSICYFEREMPNTDCTFHYLRLREVGMDLVHFKLPAFNVWTETIIGRATNSFYPWLLLLPYAFISLIVKPVTFWSILVGSGYFIGFNITFWLCLHYKHSTEYSSVLASLYILSTGLMGMIFMSNDVGSFYAMLFAPVVFLGWYHWLHNGSWRMMTLGLLCMSWVHILNTCLIILFLFVLTILNCTYKKFNINKKTFISLAKAIIVFIIGSASTWLPILYLSSTNNILFPNQTRISQFSQLHLIFFSPTRLLEPCTMVIWSFTDLIILALAFRYWKYLSSLDHKFVYVCGVIYFLNIHPIERFLIYHTVVSRIQFMHRLCFVSEFLLAYVFCDLVFHVLYKRWHKWGVQRLEELCIGILALCLGISGMTIIQLYRNQYISKVTSVNQYSNVYKMDHFRYTNNMKHIFFLNHVNIANSVDYSPQGNASNYRVSSPGAKNIQYYKNGTMSKTVKQTRYHLLPILIYHGEKYHLTINHKKIKHIKTFRHFVNAPLRKGKNIIHFTISTLWYQYLALILTFIGIVILLI